MARPRIVEVSEAEFAAQKEALAKRCVRAEVVGDQPLRDAISRESVEPGGIVHLDPKATLLDHLVRAGAIKLLAAGEPEA